MDLSTHLLIKIEDTSDTNIAPNTTQQYEADIDSHSSSQRSFVSDVQYHNSTSSVRHSPFSPPNNDSPSAGCSGPHFRDNEMPIMSHSVQPSRLTSTNCPLLYIPNAAGLVSPQLARRGSGVAMRLGVSFNTSRRGSECVGTTGLCRAPTVGTKESGAFGLLRPLSNPGVTPRRSPSAASAYASAAAEIALRQSGISDRWTFKSRECLLASIIAGEKAKILVMELAEGATSRLALTLMIRKIVENLDYLL